MAPLSTIFILLQVTLCLQGLEFNNDNVAFSRIEEYVAPIRKADGITATSAIPKRSLTHRTIAYEKHDPRTTSNTSIPEASTKEKSGEWKCFIYLLIYAIFLTAVVFSVAYYTGYFATTGMSIKVRSLFSVRPKGYYSTVETIDSETGAIVGHSVTSN